MLCCQFSSCPDYFCLWPPCKILAQFVIIISSKEQWLSQCNPINFLHSAWFHGAHNFMTFPLQCSESTDCKIKTVFNVTKGSCIFFSLKIAFRLPYNTLSFLKTVINSWEMSHPSKSHKPMKVADFFSKRRKDSKSFGQTMIFIKSISIA